MEKIYKAFARLSLKDKLVFLIVFVLIVAMVFGLLIRLSMRGIIADYPECTLARISDTQTHKDYSYEDLPSRVSFPGTNESVMVGGEQLVMTDTGVSFKYSDDFIIATFVSDKGIKKAITDTYPELLSTKKATGYESKQSGSGYMNTYALTYDAGLLRCSDAPYYIVSYMKGFAGVSVITSDKAKIKEAKRLLDRIATTFGNEGEKSLTVEDTDDAETGDVKSEGSDEGDSEEEVSVVDSLKDTTSATERMSEPTGLNGSLERNDYTDMVDITDDLVGKDIYVVFEYYNPIAVPTSAVLTGPDGFKAEACYLNEDADAVVRFFVKDAKKGVYKATFVCGQDFGHSRLYAMEKDVYDETNKPYGEFENLTPREG